MNVTDLPMDVQRHILAEAARCGPQVRGVCQEWRSVADGALRTEYEEVLCAMLGACRIRVADRAPIKWQLRYAYPGVTPLTPRYTCASCGHRVHAVANCRACRNTRNFVCPRRLPLASILLGPSVVVFGILFLKAWLLGPWRLS